MSRNAHHAPADDARDPAWDDDGWDAPERPRKGLFRRVFGLLKVAVFVMPLAAFIYGSVAADCRARPASSGWTGLLGAGACARSEILGGAFSMPDNLAVLKRLID